MYKWSFHFYLKIISAMQYPVCENLKRTFWSDAFLTQHMLNWVCQKFKNTGWSIWYCPILNIDCGIFLQISKQVFWVILITNFDTFCYLKSDFWYSKKIFCPKIMIILRVPPMKKKISSSLIWKILPDNKMYQNFHYKSYFQTYLTPRIGPQ